jgi:Recombinase
VPCIKWSSNLTAQVPIFERILLLSVRAADGVKLQIVEQEAATIRRMFELYSKGQSLKRVACLLNTEGVKSPQPQKGRVSQSWCVSSVRHVLRIGGTQGRLFGTPSARCAFREAAGESIGAALNPSGL